MFRNLLIAVLLIFAVPVLAASSTKDASTAAYQAVDDKMHQDMMITYSGNADADFVRGMIPHHQGAIDMAKVELRYGSDPAIKKMAQDVITAQTAEIAFMNNWLKQHGK